MRVLALASHPIQYQAPIFRELHTALTDGFEVWFKQTAMGNGAIDPEFGIPVRWDTPVLSGYAYTQLAVTDLERTLSAHNSRDRPAVLLLMLSYTDPLAWHALALANSAGIPVVWRFEGTDLDFGRSRLKVVARSLVLRALYQRVSCFLSIGSACDAHLLNHGVSPQRIVRSPYNVDDELFESMCGKLSGKREELRTRLGIKSHDFVFVMVGKLIDRKNPMLVLRSLYRCDDPQLKLIVVGTGPLEEEVRTYSRNLHAGQVLAVGFANQTELGQYYAAADGAILPSKFETWGLTINEAQHFALPVVVSSNVGCRFDLVKPGQTGCVFADGDAQDLCRAMLLLSQNRSRARTMGMSGHSLVQQFSTQAAVAGVLLGLDVAVTLPSVI